MQFAGLVEIPFVFVTVDTKQKAANNTRPFGGNATGHVSWYL